MNPMVLGLNYLGMMQLFLVIMNLTMDFDALEKRFRNPNFLGYAPTS